MQYDAVCDEIIVIIIIMIKILLIILFCVFVVRNF